MPPTFIGVRHHSPACAGLVRDTIRALRPVHVLVEGPADMNDRLGELLLGHELPVAVFTSYRDGDRHHASWSPFCAHSPEWVALTEGRSLGAQVRFIDLPAWHPAFAERANRYADAERRYHDVVAHLCRTFSVDNIDSLWDHLFELDPSTSTACGPTDELADRLVTYFDLVRGDADASVSDTAREAYMARWVDAAVADAGDRPVVVVTGGFHRPALVAHQRRRDGAAPAGWPDVPAFPASAVGGSYLVPFSFRRLDAFDGYQSGMPSPRYYQRLWEAGPAAAGATVVDAVVTRLRDRRQPTSTADLVAARTLALGLARLRGHAVPGRVDVLDGLASALVADALDRPLPWSGRGQLPAGTHPVVVEIVAALAGDEVGRLHPDTPSPPLVHDVADELERHALDGEGPLILDLTEPADLARSRVLHRLRVLAVPGCARRQGPGAGSVPVVTESWDLRHDDLRLSALIEAGSYGATLETAAAAALANRVGSVGPVGRAAAGTPVDVLGDVLFDAVLCGLGPLADAVLDRAADGLATVSDLGALGRLLATTLGLWRHDRLFSVAGSEPLGRLIATGVTRALWLVDGIRGGPAPADDGRIGAVVAVRDSVVHAEAVLYVSRAAVLDVFVRASAADRPPDLRGAATGLAWVLDGGGSASGRAVAAAVRGATRVDVLGDFLAGLFALAREHVLADEAPGVVGMLDEVLTAMAEPDFLVAVPALRLAFAWFPPLEREAIAQRLLDRRGLRGSARSLLRLTTDPATLAHARAVETRVADLLDRERLLVRPPTGAPGDG